MLGGFISIVVIFRTKTWDFYEMTPTTTLLVFGWGSFYLGMAKLLIDRQRKSLAYQRWGDLDFYNASLLVEEFLTAVC